jgi:predicted transcriptional regulator
MADVVAARDAYVAARKTVAQKRRELGRAILDARRQAVPQEAIARTLGLTREQIRRYQAGYEKWLRAHPAGES